MFCSLFTPPRRTINKLFTRRSFVFGLTCALLLVLLAPAARPTLTRAQQQPQEGGDDVVRVDSSLVRLNVGVADRGGRSVTNLTANDFAVYEDGVRQDITSFEPTVSPFSLVVVLDVSGSTLGFRNNLKQSAMRFVDALAPDDRVAVIAFNDRINTLAGFTSDREKIYFAIDRADGRGGTELYKALDHALKILAAEGKRRKAIVVLTDGLDSSLRSADRAAIGNAQTNEEALATFKPDANPTLTRILDDADRQGVTVYPLALPTGDPKRIPYPTPAQVAIYSGARQRIQTLADRTGGRLSDIRRLDQMSRLYVEVAAELRTLYSISYQSTGAQQQRPRDGRWRAIRIDVARPDLIARTRPGYFAR